MNSIKNVHVLDGLFPEGELKKLIAGADLHLRHSNITFKILDVSGTDFIVRTEQGKSLAGNYADAKTLIERTKQLFSKFVVPGTIKVHPVPYIEPIPNVVTPEWLAEKMLLKGVRIKDIVTDSGIPKASISNWINGTKPMSQIVKAMFYFYFTRK